MQTRLFRQFRMLNARGEERDLCELFAPTPQRTPPAGAGEGAAPKLLQYAYSHDLHPLAMAEFWWGDSPKGEVRRHGCYYPACNGKCKPILTHMLEGLDVEPNPLTGIRPPEPQIVWEDGHMVAVNKPGGMLSVAGRSGVRSVEEWARERYADATGPLIVHRLDQSTSGLLLLAKTKEAHKALQAQFIAHTIRKSYVALLESMPQRQSGTISLPLKADYDNRPRQMVASDGRKAVTRFEVLGREGDAARVRFHPVTGRTHQLRVHAAHADGLAAPIVGDDIYGTGGGRLCLHAEAIEFTHPASGRHMRLECPAEF
ncbi:MAG: RluA family pseudouridine synthase [Ruminococcus flavefaciens]|nr:RluA family pseudouridine synthase [Ruminococcus flavefaciens]